MKLRTRTEWGANPAKSTSRLNWGIRQVVLHHTVTAGTGGDAEVRGIQRYHQGTRGWADIGYNWLIGADGTVYQGRGWGIVGAHCDGLNSTSYGVALLGTYTDRSPSPAQVQAFGELIRSGIYSGRIAVAPVVRGHGQVPRQFTACPGQYTSVELFAASITDPTEVSVPEVKVAFPIVSAFPTVTGKGYTVIVADGGVYAFGDAEYFGRVIVVPAVKP